MKRNGSTGPIWVLVEDYKGSLTFASKEMLQDAAEVARTRGLEVRAVLIGGGPADEPWADQVGAFGADLLVRVDVKGLSHLTAEACALVLDRLSDEQGRPRLLLLAGTLVGREVAARLAVKWGSAFANDCVGFKINPQGLVEATRVTHGENMETIVAFTRTPAIVSFRPGSAGVGAKNDGRRAAENSVVMDLGQYDLDKDLLRIVPPDPAAMDIAEADFILAVGYGVCDRECFDKVQELAKMLGASIAGTRRANDRGWVGLERRVGLTGKTVSPQIYMAVGISGAREHVVGMDGSKVILAINRDPKAEIFRIAHKGYIGDAKEVITALLKRLRVLDSA